MRLAAVSKFSSALTSGVKLMLLHWWAGDLKETIFTVNREVEKTKSVLTD